MCLDSNHITLSLVVIEYVFIWQLDLFLFKYVAAYYARYEEKLALMSEKYQKYFFYI